MEDYSCGNPEPGSSEASVELKVEGEEGEGVKKHCVVWRYS